MQELKGEPLHQARFGGVGIAVTTELKDLIVDYFKEEGFDVGEVVCFSTNASGKINLVFEVATQAKTLARSLMGLLNRNDIEIEMNLSTRGLRPESVRVKLRDVKDVEECERLIDKLAAITVKPKQSED